MAYPPPPIPFADLKPIETTCEKATDENHQYASGQVIYGAYAARLHLDIISRWQLSKPANLGTYVASALAIKKNPQATLEDVNRFCDRADFAEVAERLPWIAHWLREVACYRTGDYKAASTHYVRAFEHAKYSAGEMQYLLMNQYLEVMAKKQTVVTVQAGRSMGMLLRNLDSTTERQRAHRRKYARRLRHPGSHPDPIYELMNREPCARRSCQPFGWHALFDDGQWRYCCHLGSAC